MSMTMPLPRTHTPNAKASMPGSLSNDTLRETFQLASGGVCFHIYPAKQGTFGNRSFSKIECVLKCAATSMTK